MKLLLSCEHGGNNIPPAYQEYFESATDVLSTHRGYDLGALSLFKKLEVQADFSLYSTTTRLLIELNRSLHHPNLYSEYSKGLSQGKKEGLIRSYYLNYRNTIQNQVQDWIDKGEEVFHFSVHSFTPIFNGINRKADIGLLYDPSRVGEKALAKRLKHAITKSDPSLNVKFNYPYLGKADGFTTYLRKCFVQNYYGIELEVNQQYSDHNMMQSEIQQAIAQALKKVMTQK